MNFIKKIFMNKVDEIVHRQFTKFSIGEFERAFINIKKSKNEIKVRTSYEFSNELFGLISENINENAEVNGSIMANRDFKNELDFEVSNYKKKMGQYVTEINTTLNKEQLKNIYEKFKSNYILLNVKSNNFKLSVGKTLPKPGKELKDNFCNCTLPVRLLDEFAFDVKEEFKDLKIKHIYKIRELIIPEEYKNDFAKIRLEAKRKGSIIRLLNIDGKEVRKEIEFIV